jgi:hypothetical protein
VVAIVTGTLFFVVIRSLKNYKPSYQWPKRHSVVELLVGFFISWLRHSRVQADSSLTVNQVHPLSR